jgi:hypothetical protein
MDKCTPQYCKAPYSTYPDEIDGVDASGSFWGHRTPLCARGQAATQRLGASFTHQSLKEDPPVQPGRPRANICSQHAKDGKLAPLFELPKARESHFMQRTKGSLTLISRKCHCTVPYSTTHNP